MSSTRTTRAGLLEKDYSTRTTRLGTTNMHPVVAPARGVGVFSPGAAVERRCPPPSPLPAAIPQPPSPGHRQPAAGQGGRLQPRRAPLAGAAVRTPGSAGKRERWVREKVVLP